MTPIVEVENLRFTYEDGSEALRGIDFLLQQGEVIALLGANGSGKTTFVQHLNGLLRGSGLVRIDGLLMEDANLSQIRRRVGLVLQDSDNQLFMPSVLEDVAFGPLASGLSAAEAQTLAISALDRVGMTHKQEKAPYHLSAGEKKRVAIAGILAMQPKLLILDEPTTFLDPPGQRALADLLAELPQAKILITHDIGFAGRLCEKAAFFGEGQILATGAIAGIVRQFGW